MKKEKFLLRILIFILKIWFSTNKREIHFLGEQKEDFLLKEDYILVTWHNQGFSLTRHLSDFFKSRVLKCMVSQSKDGEMVEYMLSFFGIGTIRGSRNKGAVSGFRELLRSVRKKETVIIAADGSTGPIYKVKEGVVKLASLCKIPIIYTFTYSKNFYELKSWDCHILPKPFSSYKIYYSEKFDVPQNLTTQQLKEYTLKLENFMKELQSKSI